MKYDFCYMRDFFTFLLYLKLDLFNKIFKNYVKRTVFFTYSTLTTFVLFILKNETSDTFNWIFPTLTFIAGTCKGLNVSNPNFFSPKNNHFFIYSKIYQILPSTMWGHITWAFSVKQFDRFGSFMLHFSKYAAVINIWKLIIVLFKQFLVLRT